MEWCGKAEKCIVVGCRMRRRSFDYTSRKEEGRDHYQHLLQRREVPRAVLSQEQKWG